MASVGVDVTGTSGNDRKIGTYGGSEFFIADAGDDYYDGASPLIGGPFGHDRSAYDTISYQNSPAGVHVDLATGTVIDGWGGHDTLVNIAYIWGSMYDDELIGDEGKNWISGLKGNDIIDGGPDKDFGYVVAYMDDPAGVHVDLGQGYAIDGWGDRDTIRNIISVHSSAFDDTIIGTDGQNDFYGMKGADHFDGRGGNDNLRYWDSGRLLDPANAAAAGGRSGVYVNLAEGYAFDEWGDKDTFLNMEGVDAGNGNDTVIGSDVVNFFHMRGGNDVYEGRGGVDFAHYQRHQDGGASTQHSWSRDDNGDWIVSSATSSEKMIGVERLQVLDGFVALDIDGNAGQGYRLYHAAFNRTPDTDGLAHWVLRLDNSTTLHEVAQAFIGSDEFRGLYGASPNNRDFVNLLYNNVLHRGADEGGFKYWIDRMGDGVDRAEVLVSFSDSVENQQNVASAVSHGIWLGAFWD